MRAYLLSLGLLAVIAVSLATTLEPWFQNWGGSRTKSDNILQVALGDSRRMFARHFFTKADVYFHNGCYPTIYDSKAGFEEAHVGESVHGHGKEEGAAEDFIGQPRDWIDRFGRHFYPARHTHLSDSGCGHSCCQRAKEHNGHDENCEHKGHEDGHDHEAEAAAKSGSEREILPWFRLSAELDPQRIETYVIASYWLRTKLDQVNEAESFLREGLRANPGDSELLLELGRIYYESRQDVARARNVFEMALKNWREREGAKPEPNVFLGVQILNQLALLEREQQNYPRAIEHYTLLKEVSPNKEMIQAWIDYLKTNGPPIAAPTLPR